MADHPRRIADYFRLPRFGSDRTGLRGITEVSKVKMPDVQILAENLPSIMASSLRLLRTYTRRLARGEQGDVEALGMLAGPFLELGRKLWRNPQRVVTEQLRLWRDSMALMSATARRMMGQEADPVIEPGRRDRRFRDAAWVENIVFDFIKQSYLLTARAIENTTSPTSGDDEVGENGSGGAGEAAGKKRYDDAAKAAFYTRQFVDAMAPSNFAMTNPEVIRATLESGGANLVLGLKNLLADLERGDGKLYLTLADRTAFELGDSLACTPGKVVYQTDLMQLIQYQPTTEQVFEQPVLLVPPWINKYYVLDLQPENSFVKWLVDQGFTVFVISWVNPDERHRDKDFEDYVTEGPLAALGAIERATGAREVHAIAYCIGGTLMAATLAHLAAQDEKSPRAPDAATDAGAASSDGALPRIVSATMLTSLIDFAQVGDMGMFIGDKELEVLDKQMERQGYLDGPQMVEGFNMLRSRELIWAFVIRNYLLARDPAPMDLLYWAGDNTRMPARMHSYYLRNMYLHNKLREPDGLTMLGTSLDVRKISLPTYFLSTHNDHIAPWRGTYEGARLLGGPVTFTLGGSGHVAGVINPAGSTRHGYWTNAELPADPGQWLGDAAYHEGSWWPSWRAWIEPHLGEQVPGRIPGDGELEVLEDAPGSFAC